MIMKRTTPAEIAALFRPRRDGAAGTRPETIDLQSPHLQAVLARLSAADREVTLVAIRGMNGTEAARWLAAVSRMSVDDAVLKIRSILAPGRLRSSWQPSVGRQEDPS